MTKRLDEIKGRLEAARADGIVQVTIALRADQSSAPGRFIVNAPTDIAYLLAMVDTMRDLLQTWCDLQDYCHCGETPGEQCELCQTRAALEEEE